MTSFAHKFAGTERKVKWSIAASLALHLSLFLALLIAASPPSNYHFDQTTFVELQGFAPEPVNSDVSSIQSPTRQAPTLKAKRQAIAVKRSRALKEQPKAALRERIMKKFRSMGSSSGAAHASQKSVSQSVPGISTGVPFPYAAYLSEMRDRIDATWHQPDWLSATTSQAMAVVVFRIHRDGALSRVALAIPSGIDAMDQSAVTAVKSANPLPALPEDFKSSYLDVHLQFHLSR